MLVENLPPDCAAARKIRGHDWVDLNHQVANLTDSVHQLMRTVAGTVTPKGRPVPHVAPVWRPTNPDVIGDTSEADQAAVLAYLDSMKPVREEPTDA